MAMTESEKDSVFSNLNKMAAAAQLRDIVAGSSLLNFKKSQLNAQETSKIHQTSELESYLKIRRRIVDTDNIGLEQAFLTKVNQKSENTEKYIRKNRKVLSKIIENNSADRGHKDASGPLALDHYLVEETKNLRISLNKNKEMSLEQEFQGSKIQKSKIYLNKPFIIANL